LFAGEDDAVTKIRSLLSDPGLSQSVRTFLSQRAELFSTDSFCESVVALVSDILEGVPSHSDDRPSQAQLNSIQIGNHGT
jgi:hypothetical protein